MMLNATRRGLAAVRKPGTAAIWRLRNQAVRRLGWGVADQAASSLTNFAVVIYVAHTLGAAQLGAFSLAYVTYHFGLNVSRGLASYPLQVRFSGTDLRAWRRAVSECTGAATVVGVAAAACVLGAATLLDGTTGAAFLALGLTLPGLLLQDNWRYAFFALGRGSQAFLNDMAWAAALLASLLFLHAIGGGGVFWYVFAWGAAANLAALLGPLQAQVIPQLSGAWHWISQHRDLGFRYVTTNFFGSAAAQVRAYSVRFILGLAAVGYVQAAGTLMGPFQVVLFSSSLVVVPEAVRVLRRSPRRLPVFCLAVSGTLITAGVAWGALLEVALPRGIGEWLLGGMWPRTYALVLPTTLFILGLAANGGPAAGLGALGAARRSLIAGVAGSSAVLAGAVLGAAAGGTVGTVTGAALGMWSGAFLTWWQLRGALGDPETERGGAERTPAGRPRGLATRSAGTQQ